MSGERLSATRQKWKYVACDYITGVIAFMIFNIARALLITHEEVWSYVFSGKLLAEALLFPIGMLGIYWLSGYYNLPFGKSRLQELLTTFFSALINTAIIYFILLINDQTGERRVNYELLGILISLFFVIPYIGRRLITNRATRLFREHQWEFRTLIIGNSPTSRRVAASLNRGPVRVGCRILGFVEIPGEESVRRDENDPPVFPFEDIDRICAQLEVDQLVIASENYSDKRVLMLLYKLFHLGLPIKIAPDTLSYVTSSIRLNDIFAEPFVDLTSPALSEASKNVKRMLDVVTSAVVLMMLSPLYAALAIAVKRSSPGPVFYRQERIGLKQRPFDIIKFRTMYTDAEAAGPRLSADNDPRITPVGRILRKYRLDELPQFWNVLKGEMSIVGPRPERAYFIEQIMKEAPYYALVYQVRPGITSWGMVKYGYASNVAQMVERTRYDLIYMSNMSLFVDIKILIYTVRTVVTGKGL